MKPAGYIAPSPIAPIPYGTPGVDTEPTAKIVVLYTWVTLCAQRAN